MKFLIMFFYLFPLILPFAYSFSMLSLGIILSAFLLYYYAKRRLVYRLIQKDTDVDLSNFMKIHFFLIERGKYIISEEELMIGYKSEKARKILNNNQELFLKISPVWARKFFYYNGKIFIFKIWLILTTVFAVFFI